MIIRGVTIYDTRLVDRLGHSSGLLARWTTSGQNGPADRSSLAPVDGLSGDPGGTGTTNGEASSRV